MDRSRLDEWERTTIATAHRSRRWLRIVLGLLLFAWVVNVFALFAGGSRWNWAALVVLPMLAALNVRSTSRLGHRLDESLLRIEAERMRQEGS